MRRLFVVIVVCLLNSVFYGSMAQEPEKDGHRKDPQPQDGGHVPTHASPMWRKDKDKDKDAKSYMPPPFWTDDAGTYVPPPYEADDDEEKSEGALWGSMEGDERRPRRYAELPESHQLDTIHIDPVAVAYYSNIVKKHGWMVGVGEAMTLEEASHLNCYYKLSLKNNAGNWTCIEALDGCGNLTTSHSMVTYLINHYRDDDPGANAEITSALSTVCKWEFIGDCSGENVIEERALDVEGQLVYSFRPVKVTGKTPNFTEKYIGSYADRYGRPMYMRTDSLGNDAGYANFVNITRDGRGFDVILAYVDRNGYPQKNRDGAYMTILDYDDQGRQIMEASANVVGDYIIDSWGNCGWNTVYPEPGVRETTYRDASWEPMRMPVNRKGSDNVYGYRYFSDEYGRDTLVRVIDQKGEADTNQFGVHEVRYQYDDRGRITSIRYYDMEGDLHPRDTYGIAQTVYGYDKDGNIELVEFLDADNNCVDNPDLGFCRLARNYVDGKMHSEILYLVQDKEYGTIAFHDFEYSSDGNGNEVRVWYADNMVRIDSVDVKNRSTLTAYYDLLGNPIENDEGLHKHIITFDDSIDMSVECWYDADGDLYDPGQGYSKSVEYTDYENAIMTNYQYKRGLLKYSFQKKFTPDFKDIIEQWDITPYGEHARVGCWGNIYYTCVVDYTHYGEIRTMMGKNEFGEPSYMVCLDSEDEEVYYISDKNNGAWRYYDEYGSEIPEGDMSAFKDSLPKAFCLEVTDTTVAYPLGLRNGDIVISFGDWTIDKDLKSNIQEFYLETIIKANEGKDIVLLRHDPDQKTSEIVVCVLPEGRTSDLGFYPHLIYYTQREKERLLKTCSENDIFLRHSEKQGGMPVLLCVPIKGGMEETTLYHLPMYDVKDPGVLLYAKEKYNGRYDTWDIIDGSFDSWDNQAMFYIQDSHIYFTQDLSSVRHVLKESRGYGGMRFFPVMVSDNVYDTLVANCYETLGDERVVIEPELEHTKKNLYGHWTTEIESGVLFRMSLERRGEVNITFDIRQQQEFQGGVSLDMHYVFSLEEPGIWTLQPGGLCLNVTDGYDGHYEYFKLEGVSTGSQNLFKEYFEECLREQLKDLIAMVEGLRESEFVSLTDNYMSLSTNDGFLMFIRQQ